MRCAPWSLRRSAMLIHCLDPNMRTPSQVTLAASPENAIFDALRGRTRLGPQRWEPRRDALAKGFASWGSRVVINPGEACEELRIALGGGFHYKTDAGGEARGEAPDKSHPHSDLVDALSYVLCEVWPEQDRAARHASASAPKRAIGGLPTVFDLLQGRGPSGYENW